LVKHFAKSGYAILVGRVTTGLRLNMRKTPTPPTPQMLSRRQLAERWTCSIETLRRRERDGTLNTRRIGSLVRYRLRDIEAIEEDSKA